MRYVCVDMRPRLQIVARPKLAILSLQEDNHGHHRRPYHAACRFDRRYSHPADAAALKLHRRDLSHYRRIGGAQCHPSFHLERDPEKHALGLDPRVATGFPKRSCAKARFDISQVAPDRICDLKAPHNR